MGTPRSFQEGANTVDQCSTGCRLHVAARGEIQDEHGTALWFQLERSRLRPVHTLLKPVGLLHALLHCCEVVPERGVVELERLQAVDTLLQRR